MILKHQNVFPDYKILISLLPVQWRNELLLTDDVHWRNELLLTDDVHSACTLNICYN